VKKRKLVFFTFFILCFIYISVSLIFGDSGLVRYRELNKTKQKLELQVAEINKQNAKIREQIELLKKDPLYREKLAREEYGLARPDEYIFLYDK
jgi:cell division protein FtsB